MKVAELAGLLHGKRTKRIKNLPLAGGSTEGEVFGEVHKHAADLIVALKGMAEPSGERASQLGSRKDSISVPSGHLFGHSPEALCRLRIILAAELARPCGDFDGLGARLRHLAPLLEARFENNMECRRI